MNYKTRVAAIAIAAVAVIGTGVGFASSAHAATTETTSFTFPIGSTPSSTLSITNGTVPPNATIVNYDLEQFVQTQYPNATGTTLATDIASAVNTLETGGTYTPATGLSVTAPNAGESNFANVPQEQTPGNQSTYVLPTSDTTVSLYVIASNANTSANVTAATFEVSTQISGTPLTFGNTTGSTVSGIVTWADNSTTPPVVVTAPSVSAGQVLSVSHNRAEVDWTESATGWPDPNLKCEEVWISGFGFGSYNGSDPSTSHVGFTCDTGHLGINYGFLSGLQAHHTYALQIVPATGTYGNHTPIPGAGVGYVDVFTP